MWPFRQQKPWRELGEDVPTIVSELKARTHWKRLPESLIQHFGTNAMYVFGRPTEASYPLKHFVFLMESKVFRELLQQIEVATKPRDEVSALPVLFDQFAVQSLDTVRPHNDRQSPPYLADAALSSSLICERYALNSYAMLAQLLLVVGQNRQEAALWCDRYRRAERDLLAEDELNLSSYARFVKGWLDPEKRGQTSEEMRKVLPKHLLEERLPDLDSADPVTAGELVAQIESLILEEMCHGAV